VIGKQAASAILIALAVQLSSAADAGRTAPLVTNGDAALTTTDFDAYVETIPEQHRAEFATNVERVKKTVDAMWTQRAVARMAREAGVEKDPAVAARLARAQEQVLVEAYMRKLDRELKLPDLVPRAREVYVSNPAAYKAPGRVHIQQVLVDMKCRKPEEALKRAREIRAQIVAGKEAFTEIAKRESDDPNKDKHGGDYGFQPLSAFQDEEFRKAVEKLKPGEVSEPFETRFGVHVVKMVKREPERQRTFDEVKDEIVAVEKQKLVDEMRLQVLAKVQTDPQTRVYLENVDAVVDKARAAAKAETKPKP
jgi:peptidyl-prolyl cis-trans isomerase C